MVAGHPQILVPRHGEQGLFWGILLSALAHGAAIGAFVMLSRHFASPSPAAVSYTVDLVASAEPAGTNLVPGGGKSTAPPAAVPPKPLAEARPAPKNEPVESAKASPASKEPVPEKLSEPKPPPKPEEPKPEAKPAKVPVPPPPEKQPVAVVEKPPAPKPAAEPAKKSVAELGTKPALKKPEPASKPQPAQSVVARAEQPKPEPSRAAAKAKPSPQVETAADKKAEEARARDQQIATAIQRREQDQRIAAAVAGRAKALQEGGASGRGSGEGRGGPISLGQGSGSGGTVEGLEMILYRGQLERRIKENWVWAGEDQSLEVKIQFEITEGGDVVNVRTTTSSGNRSYDASAERAVRAASPLPPPPEKYRNLFTHGVELTFRAQDLKS